MLSSKIVVKRIQEVIIIFSYICMFIPHYASDTYHAIMNADVYGRGNIVLGRYTSELIYSIAIKLGIDYIKAFPLLIAFIIISLVIMIEIVSDLFMNALNRESEFFKYIIAISILLCVINPFICEWFAFYECSLQWGGCVIFSALAIKTFPYDNYDYKRWFISLLFMIISLGFYQAFMPVFVIIACTLIYLKSEGKLNKYSITKTISVCAIGGISSVINILSIRFFQYIGIAAITSRTDSINMDILIGNLKVLVNNIPILLWETCGLFPKGILVISSIVMLGIAFGSIISNKHMVINKMLYIFLLVLGDIAVVFMPHLFTSTIWMAQRTIVGLWSIIFTISVITIVNMKHVYCERTVLVIVVMLLMTSIYMIQSVQNDLIAMNYKDRNEAYAIQQKINEYEAINGVEIKSIGIISDKNVSYHSVSSKYLYCDTNISAHAVSWAAINCMNYYNGTAYERVEVPQSIIDAYTDYDRDYLCLEEQLVFDEDRLYIIEY